jgi:hypothetical protein
MGWRPSLKARASQGGRKKPHIRGGDERKGRGPGRRRECCLATSHRSRGCLRASGFYPTLERWGGGGGRGGQRGGGGCATNSASRPGQSSVAWCASRFVVVRVCVSASASCESQLTGTAGAPQCQCRLARDSHPHCALWAGGCWAAAASATKLFRENLRGVRVLGCGPRSLANGS